SDECNMCGSASGAHTVLGRRLNRAQGKWPRNKVGVAITIVKCTDCGLIFPNPLPIPSRIEDHYGVNPEHYWKDEYFRFEETYFLQQIDRFKALYGGYTKASALDIGAGIGKCMIALMRADFDVFGIEGSESFYRAAIDRNGISPERISLATMEQAIFGPASFD